MEQVVSNPVLLKKYNDYTKALICKGIFLYYLFHKVENKDLLYKVCLIFFKHGFSTDTLVYDDKTFFKFICELKREITAFGLFNITYEQLIYLSLFFNKSPISIKQLEMQIPSHRELKFVKNFFQDDLITSSIKSTYIESITLDAHSCLLISAFLDASLIQGINVITKQTWNFQDLFCLLYSRINKLWYFVSPKEKHIILYILKDIIKYLFIVSIKPEFSIRDFTDFYKCIKKKLEMQIITFHIGNRCLDMLEKYLGTKISISKSSLIHMFDQIRKRNREED